MADVPSVPFEERLYCSKNDVVVYVGTCLSWVDKKIAAGRLETKKVGKRRLVVVASLLSLIEEEDCKAKAKRATGAADVDLKSLGLL